MTNTMRTFQQDRSFFSELHMRVMNDGSFISVPMAFLRISEKNAEGSFHLKVPTEKGNLQALTKTFGELEAIMNKKDIGFRAYGIDNYVGIYYVSISASWNGGEDKAVDALIGIYRFLDNTRAEGAGGVSQAKFAVEQVMARLDPERERLEEMHTAVKFLADAIGSVRDAGASREDVVRLEEAASKFVNELKAVEVRRLLRGNDLGASID